MISSSSAAPRLDLDSSHGQWASLSSVGSELTSQKEGSDSRSATVEGRSNTITCSKHFDPFQSDRRILGPHISKLSPFSRTIATARAIDDFGVVSYPAGIIRREGKVNVSGSGGIFRYDRQFLLQFMNACKAKPDFLINLETFGLVPGEQPLYPLPKKTKAVKASRVSQALPTISILSGVPTTSSNASSRPGDQPPKSTRSKRRGKRRGQLSLEVSSVAEATQPKQTAMPGALPDNVSGAAPDPSNSVEEEVKGLLTDLSEANFDLASDRMIQMVNQSAEEQNCRTLAIVSRLIPEIAVDIPALSNTYAGLCRKMMAQVSDQVRDASIKNHVGEPMYGGQLFRKYLLQKCREEYESSWADAGNSPAELDLGPEPREGSGATRRSKRLGATKFLSELFHVEMLTERIMHESIKKILRGFSAEPVQEDSLECFCVLMTVVGRLLDKPKARSHMNVYFQRVREAANNPEINPRVKALLQIYGRGVGLTSADLRVATGKDCTNPIL
ncbi:hypothetical protein NP233_g1447 [Leucocoprinus birnbaumii]|uniref:MIF4G domain-containing protein n=1 Tax=Leucocoprinus birnbaumii TaxID=56174 RepID=A0AAD5W0B8_9AGAR|nr:hypothetical protein NP233_g1447 [Leucocoprinus birnbaumii]